MLHKERGAGSKEQGAGRGAQGAGSGERGAENGERIHMVDYGRQRVYLRISAAEPSAHSKNIASYAL